MEQVSSPLPFTNKEIRKLNNGSVTFEQALALFNVDSSTFKETLQLMHIYAWRGPNKSLVRVDGDYDITIYLKGMQKRFVVKFTSSFEDVIHMLEKHLNLSPGCYKLTTKHFIRNIGKVRVMTARDWDYAVWHSKMTRGYIVLLHLEVLAPGQTADGGVRFEDVCDAEADGEHDLTYDDFVLADLDDYDYDYHTFYLEDAFNEDDVSGNSTKRITKQRILSLNNGSVTFEQARASFNVDLSTFKARLEQLNIFVWNDPMYGRLRIHGGDYDLKILIKDRGMLWYAFGTNAFEDVSRDLENQLGLSPGCYKLTFKHPNRSMGDVWLKSDSEWHFAVSLAKLRGYCVILYLDLYGEDAHDKRRSKRLKRA